jgi:hypothetical protein
VTARPGRPLISDWPSIGVDAAAGKPFQLNASSQFKASSTGVAVVVSARSHPKGRVTIGEVVREGPDTAGTVLPLRMMKSFSLPLLGQSSAGDTWYLDSSLRPVEAGKTYTVCLTGDGDGGGVQYFADMICYYFPL